MSIRN